MKIPFEDLNDEYNSSSYKIRLYIDLYKLIIKLKISTISFNFT